MIEELSPEIKTKLQTIVKKYFPDEQNDGCKLNKDDCELYMYGTLDNADYDNLQKSIAEIEKLMNAQYIGVSNISGKHTFVYKLK